jgi:hypothetical protein
MKVINDAGHVELDSFLMDTNLETEESEFKEHSGFLKA